MEQLVRRDPRPCGLTQPRGTLDAIRSPLVWGRAAALRGIARIRDRLGITWQRARRHGPRPDPHDPANLQEIADVGADAPAHPNQGVTVDRDAVPVTRRPTLANGYGRAGADPVRAERSRATECDLRSVGSLDVMTGQVVTRRATTMGLATLAPCSPDRRAASPEAERIAVILDHWPVHGHPDVLVARAPHTTRWALSRPGNGPAPPSGRAVRRAGEVRLPIQTDAGADGCIVAPSGCEQLGRWMRQEVTRVHRWATDRDQVRSHLDAFFASLATGSSKLFQYVGLG